jgi:hypothetical protein
MAFWRRPSRPPADPSASPDSKGSIEFYDISWLAVLRCETEAILHALGLSDALPVDFRTGYGAVWGDQWDFDAPLDADLARVLITPPVAGWRAVIGGWLALEMEKQRHADHRPLRAWCERLSRDGGAAGIFTIQARSDWYGWMLARDGKVRHEFLWADDIVVDQGELTASEARSRQQAAGGRWRPEASDVLAVAGEASIAPELLEKGLPAGPSCLLAMTEWGRAQAAALGLAALGAKRLWRSDASCRRIADHREEFPPRRLVVAEGAEHAARHHGDAGLVHAARRHAVVRRFDDDGGALRLQHAVERVGDLRRHLLLDLQPP